MNTEIDQLIRQATLTLLKKKEYKDIQMQEIAKLSNIGRRTLYRYYGCKDAIMDDIVNELMDDFASIINQNNQFDLEGIAYAYFLFWEKNMDVMKLLKKAHLMYLLEDNLPELIRNVSLKTKYKDKNAEEIQILLNQMSLEDTYNYNYMLAGYFKIAQLWMEEKNRKPAREMAKILKKIVLREGE